METHEILNQPPRRESVEAILDTLDGLIEKHDFTIHCFWGQMDVQLYDCLPELAAKYEQGILTTRTNVGTINHSVTIHGVTYSEVNIPERKTLVCPVCGAECHKVYRRMESGMPTGCDNCLKAEEGEEIPSAADASDSETEARNETPET